MKHNNAPSPESSTRHKDNAWSKSAKGISLIYAAIGITWIIISDVIASHQVPGPEQVFLNSAKGTLYVIVTAFFLYALVKRSTLSLEKHARELAESEARFRAMFEEASLAIALCDEKGSVTSINPALQKIFGYTPAEVRSFPNLSSLFHPDDISSVQSDFRKMVSGEILNPPPTERRYLRKDGKVFWGRQVTSAVRTATGHFSYAVYMIEDITQEKTLADKLLQAQKMEAVGRLAGGVAHDFNNLLTVIIGYSDSMASLHKSDTKEGVVSRKILDAAEKARDLTQQLLAFSRRQVLQPRLISINTHLESACKLLGRLLAENIKLSINLDPSAGNVEVDPIQLTQLIMNLVLNARDAMPEGGRLSISTVKKEIAVSESAQLDVKPGEYAHITVTDAGCGMDRATQDKLFEPFFTTKGADKGTGLGLSTVYGIVKQSGGYIKVISAPGSGSTFAIGLPRTDKILREEEIKENPQPELGKEDILVVEDNAEIREVIAEILKGSGYRVHEAATPGDAIWFLTAHRELISLVLTDVIMPEMDGRLLANRLRALQSGLAVIFMSGYPGTTFSFGDNEYAKSFLQKPFLPSQLLAKVREVLDR